jgi:hypothetical protein
MGKLGNTLSKPPVLALAVMVLVGFYLSAYPVMGALMQEHTPKGGEFDTSFAYSPAEAARKASLYDEAGSGAMIRLHWTYDLAFPVAYGLLLSSAWAFGLRLAAGATGKPRYSLLLVPFAAVLFDLFENASVSVLLAAEGAGAPGSVSLTAARMAAVAASCSTVLKWVFVLVAFAGAIVLPVAGLVAAFLRRRKAGRAAG